MYKIKIFGKYKSDRMVSIKKYLDSKWPVRYKDSLKQQPGHYLFLNSLPKFVRNKIIVFFISVNFIVSKIIIIIIV